MTINTESRIRIEQIRFLKDVVLQFTAFIASQRNSLKNADDLSSPYFMAPDLLLVPVEAMVEHINTLIEQITAEDAISLLAHNPPALESLKHYIQTGEWRRPES